ncbi:MAG: hypothetical protein ABIL05_00680 [candidate division WOR-3 bacterium]
MNNRVISSIASGPLTRITPIADIPAGVAGATIVSPFGSIGHSPRKKKLI